MVSVLRKPSTLKIATTVGQLVGRRLFGRNEREADLQLAENLSTELDAMKGIAMKIGQIVSYMDVPLPESVQEKLSRLQTGVVAMSQEETRRAFETALGASFFDRVDAFDLTPIAAASIGQVHRARFRGSELALKIRYPDALAKMTKDLERLHGFARLASLATAVNGRALVDELAARFAEECDYLREAENQRFFHHGWSHSAEMLIPKVIDEWTTSTTLASEWVEGQSFKQIQDLSAAQRNAYAQTLVKFSYGSLCRLCAIQADPHPGNFLFVPDNRVAFLDFGCVRHFPRDWVDTLRMLISSIDHNNHALFRESVIALGMAPKPDRFDFAHHFAMMKHVHAPLLTSSFEFTSNFVELGLAFNGPRSPNARQMGIAPPYIWVARLQWGLWSLLSRLRAKVELRSIYDEFVTPLQPNRQGDRNCASRAQ